MTPKSFRNRFGKGQDGIAVLALFLFGILALSLPSANTAWAAADTGDSSHAGKHALGVDVGQVLLMGDFSKDFSDSLGWGFTYSYEASDMFGLMAEFSRSSHSNADGSNSLGITGLSPNLRVNLAYFDKLVLYGVGGFGLFHVDESISRVPGSVWTFGLNLGAGFLLDLSDHFAFGTSIAFHNIFTKNDPATVTTATPGGFSIGGTYMGIFLNIFYIF